MVQESFLVAREVLRKIKQTPNGAPATQFLSQNALVACSRVAKVLATLELSVDEEEVRDQLTDLPTLENFTKEYTEKFAAQREKNTKVWKKVYSFSQFVGPVLDVFKQASLSPECTLAFGLIGLLIIQPLNNKSEIEEKLGHEIDELKHIISQVKFSKDTIPTPEMDIEIQGLCAAIIDFLLQALHYQKKSGIVKLLKSIVSDFAKRFQGMVDKIRGHSTRIEALAQRGYVAVIMSSKDTLDRTEQKIWELEQKLADQTTWIDMQVSRMNLTLAHCMSSIEDNSKVQAIKYIQQASTIMSPEFYDLECRKDDIRQQERWLAPKEHWQNHIHQIQFPGWMNHECRPVLWIGGKKNRRGVSWVSSFSLDLIEALEMEPAVTIACILCEESEEEKYSPLNIFKDILIQVLNAHSEIICKPENFASLPFRVFEQVGNSTEAAFRLLGKLLKMIDEEFRRNHCEVFILIDRIDHVLATDKEPQKFLNMLQKLNQVCDTLRIILTSAHPAPNEGMLLGGEEQMLEVWVDTTKSLPMELLHD